MKILFSILDHSIALQFKVMKTRHIEVYGFTNRTKDGYYLPFLDYDRIQKDWMINELKAIQKEFNLSDFYIFKTSKESYHALTLDKLPFRTFKELIFRSSCDENYKEVPLKYGKQVWILRNSKKRQKKPQLIYILKSESKYMKSNAHKKFLKLLYDLDIKDQKFDKQTELCIGRYNAN